MIANVCILSPTSPWSATQEKEVQVIHGRLREKTIAKIARDSIGVCLGLADDGGVKVQVTAIVAEKNKSITSVFSASILEPQKADAEPKAADSSTLVKEKKFAFLSGPGGTVCEVVFDCLLRTRCTCHQTSSHMLPPYKFAHVATIHVHTCCQRTSSHMLPPYKFAHVAAIQVHTCCHHTSPHICF